MIVEMRGWLFQEHSTFSDVSLLFSSETVALISNSRKLPQFGIQPGREWHRLEWSLKTVRVLLLKDEVD
jgi:hypothetical protein